MRGLVKVGVVLSCLVLLPAVVFAQAGLAGNVKDSSGAVLPGVTVEAASPALIEKTRSVVTDGGGNYKIENIRPGTYSVTFTLPGFNTVKRDGIELAGSFVATVNADMKVGAIEETITVTGETPIVDIQSTARQQVLNKDVIEAIPTGRSYSALGVLLPGVNSTTQDVGGQTAAAMDTLTMHGSAGGDQRDSAERPERDDAADGRREHRRDGPEPVGRAGSGGGHGRDVGRTADERRDGQLHPARRRQHVQELQLLHLLEREPGEQQPDEPGHRPARTARRA